MTQVRVTGVESLDEERVEAYFSSRRRSGGGDIANFDHRGRVIIITFEEAEAASGVLFKQDHVVDGQPVQVELYDPYARDDVTEETADVREETAVVRVTGLSPDVDDETLATYFQSGRKSGGGEVVGVERRRQGREALVTFQTMTAAQRVASKLGHKIKDQPITVDLYDPENDVTEQLPVVKVTGLPPDMEDDMVQSYFENKRKSGGGDVASLERRKRGREAIITFENMEDAQRVASRDHDLKGQPVTVELYNPDDDVTQPKPVVKVTGLTPEIDDDQLETYFGSKRKSGGGNMEKVERRKKGRDAIIFFEEMEVAQRVVDKSSHAIKKQPITVELYDPDDDVIEELPIIKVTGLPPDMEDESLETYFESNRKSGGGEVVRLERRKKGREVIVTFEEVEVAKRVASKPHHDIRGQQFTVALFDREEDVIVPVPVVKVTGLRADMEDEDLVSYFESKRKSGGDEVVNMERRRRGREALVTFEGLEVAQRVASKPSHAIKRQPIVVELYDPDDDVTDQVPVVKVTGLPPDMEDEMVQAYFENKRKSGGGEVVNLVRKKRGREAIVTFENMEDAERVLGRDKHTLNKAQLTVAALDEDEKDEDEDDDEGEEAGAEGGPGRDDVNAEAQNTGSEAATSTVKVTGHDETLTGDTLTLYMENENKSGGGDVTSVDVLPKENAFLVTFQSPKVAQRVADRDRHSLGGKNLQVRLYTPPPMYEDRVLVQGVPEEVSQDTLTLYLENASGLDIVGVLYGDQPGDLLVSFQGKVDFAKMQEAFRRKKLSGQSLSMSRVEVTRCVAVRPVKDKNLVIPLELHFENEKRSGGKDVESIDFFPEYQQAVVKFEDHQVAERVSRQKQKVGGQELEVSLHHECLGPSGGSSEPVCYSLPEPLPVADVDSRKATYVEGHAKAAANLKKALDRADADFQVQNGSFVLVCTIPEGTKLKSGVAKEWGGKARSTLDNFLKDLAVEEIAVSPAMIQGVLDGGKKSLKDWPRFSLIESPKGRLAVVGPQDDMVEVKKVLAAVIADVRSQQNLKTGELAVKSPAKIQLLKAAGVPQYLKIRFPQLKVDFNVTDQKVLLTGTSEELVQGKLSFLQLQESMGETPTDLSSVQVQLLKQKEAANYLIGELSKLDDPVSWMEQGGRVYLLTLPGADTRKAQQVLQKSVLQTTFQVPAAGTQVFSSTLWIDKLRQWGKQYQGTWVLSLDEPSKVLNLAALPSSLPTIEKEIKAFLSSHSPRQSPPSQRIFLQQQSPGPVPGQDDNLMMLEIQDLKTSVASLTEEKEKMAVNTRAAEKERDALNDQNTELEQRIDALRVSHEKSLGDTKEQVRILENKMQALEQENRSLRTEKEGNNDEAAKLRQSIEQLRTQKAQLEKSKVQTEISERELQQQLHTLHSKLADLEQQLKETTAESERFQTQSADLEKKKTALELELDTQASDFARMMAAKERERSEAARRAQAAEKSLSVTERRMDVLKVESAKFQARLESEQKENVQLQSKLENEMRLCEEFRRLLEKEPDKAEAFHQQVAAALDRVERGLHQVAENLSHRQKVSDLERTFMDRLPPDVKALSIDLQRKIGGHGLKFAQLLLGSSFSLSEEDLEEGGLFFSSRKFWLCIKKWVEASSRAAAPLTSEHLRKACSGLVVDPTKLIPITPAHEQVLESNFAYLVENIRVVDIMPYLRRSPLMTADAWSFLLDGRGESQKVDRLLAVIYSTGEEGYKDLIGAMRDSWNQHILGIFPQDEAKDEALKRAGLSSENEMAKSNASNEDESSATAAPPEVTDADTRRPSDDEEDDEDSEESNMRSLTNALAEMESRVLAKLKEVESSVKDTLTNVTEVKSVSEGVLAGIEQVGEATRLVEKGIDAVKQVTKASAEALGGMVERGFQEVTTETKKAQEDVLTEIDQVKVIARTVAEEVTSAIQETKTGFQEVTLNMNRTSEGVLAGIEQVREATRSVEKEVDTVKQETKASSEALGGMVEKGFQGVRIEVNSARDGVLAGIEQVREATRSVERGVNGVRQEVVKSGSEAKEIKKCVSALEQEVRRPRGLLDRMFAKRPTEQEQASSGRKDEEGGGEV